jgi:deoxycytidylate deaminase
VTSKDILEPFVWNDEMLEHLRLDGFETVEVVVKRPGGEEMRYHKVLSELRPRPLAYGQGLETILEQGHDVRSAEAAHLYWTRIACDAAMLSLCQDAKCGAALVGVPLLPDSLFGGRLLSVGHNVPPAGLHNRRCGRTEPSKRHPKADRSCCVHAEVKALWNADRSLVEGSTLYFARVDAQGTLQPSGRPWCTGCSKLALDLGVADWVLWHEDGPRRYGAAEYNDLSHDFDSLEDAERAEAAGCGLRQGDSDG